jgi:hypothetical protein
MLRQHEFVPRRPGYSRNALDSVQVKLSGLELRRPRAFGNCWLACERWRQIELDKFWQRRLPEAREAVSWEKVLRPLVVNRAGTGQVEPNHSIIANGHVGLIAVQYETIPSPYSTIGQLWRSSAAQKRVRRRRRIQ